MVIPINLSGIPLSIARLFGLKWNRQLAMTCVNYSGMLYTLFLILSELIIGAGYTCPLIYGLQACFWPIIFGCLTVFNVLFNWYMFLKTSKYNKPSFYITGFGPTKSLDIENNAKSATEDVKFCMTCQQYVPKRCHHCPLCDQCIMRKDHHCFMTGSCVGLANHRYFLTFLVWATIGAFYGTLYCFRYLDRYLNTWYPIGWLDYLCPIAIVKYIFLRHCSFGTLCMTGLFTCGCAGCWGGFGFLTTQMIFVCQGRTMWEAMHRFQICDGLSAAGRMRFVMGPNWLLGFVCPIMLLRHSRDFTLASFVHSGYLKEL